MAISPKSNPLKKTTLAPTRLARRRSRFVLHPSQPSDSLVKWAFKQPSHAESLLRAVFPDAVSALLERGTVVVEDTGHVNAALRARHGDLVLSLRLRRRLGRLVALIEQQRTVHERMMLRTGDYMFRTWQKLGRAPHRGRLPPIVAILLYNGDRPWTAPTTFQELVPVLRAARGAERDAATAWLVRHTPHFEMHLVELRGGRMEGVVESALTPLSRVVLWCLSVVGQDEVLEEGIGRIAGSLNEVLQGPEAEDALEALLRYLAATHPGLSAEKIRTMVEKVVGPPGQEVIVSFLDEIKNEGKREGRKEGRKEGQEALARTLLQLLARRFGALSTEVEEQVLQAGEAALHRWTLRVLDAASVEDVLRKEPRAAPHRGAAGPAANAAQSRAPARLRR